MNLKVVLLSLLAIGFIILAFILSFWFIIGAIIIMFINQRLLMKKEKEKIKNKKNNKRK